MGKVCYNNTPEREGVFSHWRCWFGRNVASQSRKTRWKSCAISKNFALILCWMRRPLVRLEKVIFEEEKRLKTLATSGFSASFMFRYLPLISSKIRRCITPWKPFAQKARVAKRRESVRKQLSVVFPRAWPSSSENRIPRARSTPRSAKYSSYLRREELLASSRTTRNA